MKKTLYVLLILITAFHLKAQQIDFILSREAQQLSELPVIELPSFDFTEIKRQDSINDLDKSIPWRYGIERVISVNTDKSGVWDVLDNGDKIWRVAIKSPNAINMSVNFGNFYLPEDTSLQFYNLDKSDISRSYSNKDNVASKSLGSWFVEGDQILVAYYQPAHVTSTAELEIGSIIHGYRLGMLNTLTDFGRGLNDSGSCNYDVNCDIGSDFEDQKNRIKKAVALLNLGNGFLCSSVLLNNTLQDKKPLLLTANHCLEGSNPELWSIRFNWMSPVPVCGRENFSVDIQSNFTMSGAQLRASNDKSDFALVELFNEVPSSWDITFAGWDRSDNIPKYQIGIHHPNGDIMKICRDDDPASKEMVNNKDVWLIKGNSAGSGNGWDIGTTENGSSGSPLFNDVGKVIGQLYAGQSFCNGIEVNREFDIYGRFATSWNAGSMPETRLLDWLDPLGLGVSSLETLDNALSTNEIELVGQLEVYPNPASEIIEVKNTRFSNLVFNLFDISGKKIKSGNVSNSENRISLYQIQSGMYFLQLLEVESQREITKKIIVQK